LGYETRPLNWRTDGRADFSDARAPQRRRGGAAAARNAVQSGLPAAP